MHDVDPNGANGRLEQCGECDGTGSIRFVGQAPCDPDCACPWCQSTGQIYVENE